MPVTVKLLDLVALPDSRPLWPAEFHALIAKLEDNPEERAQWGVIADWLDENDEPELAAAFRWLSNRNIYRVEVDTPARAPRRISTMAFRNRAPFEFYAMPECRADPAIFAATVRGQLEKAREKVKKTLEELA